MANELKTELNQLIKNYSTLKNEISRVDSMTEQLESEIKNQRMENKKLLIGLSIIFLGFIFKGFVDSVILDIIYVILILSTVVYYRRVVFKRKNYNENGEHIKVALRSSKIEILELCKKIYDQDLIPHEYLNYEYLSFILKSLDYENVNNLNDSISELDLEINKKGKNEISESVKSANEKLMNEFKSSSNTGQTKLREMNEEKLEKVLELWKVIDCEKALLP